MFEIQGAAIGGEAVGCDEEWRPKAQIVARYLLKSRLGEAHFRRFTFHQQPGLNISIENNDVATSLEAIHLNPYLRSNAVCRAFFFFQQIEQYQLTQEFLGGEHHFFLSYWVVYKGGFPRLCKAKFGLKLEEIDLEQQSLGVMSDER